MSRPGDTSDDHQPTPTGDHEPDIDPDAEFDGPPIVEIAEAIRREGAPVPRRLGRSVVAEDRALGEELRALASVHARDLAEGVGAPFAALEARLRWAEARAAADDA